MTTQYHLCFQFVLGTSHICPQHLSQTHRRIRVGSRLRRKQSARHTQCNHIIPTDYVFILCVYVDMYTPLHTCPSAFSFVTRSSLARNTVPTHTRWLKVCQGETDVCANLIYVVADQQVFHDCDELIPEWLNSVKDGVDSEDLSLGISRGLCNETRSYA